MTIRMFHPMVAVIALMVGLAAPAPSADTLPLAALREAVDQALAVLDEHLEQGDQERKLREARIRQLALTHFDFAAMSRLVLGERWHDFTSEEQAAFEAALTRFLLRTYVPQLLDRYRGERIEYLRQVRLSAARARVEVRVWREGKAIPVSVKMMRRKGQWKIYDLDALGFSAVGNYRAQFAWLLRRETPAQVIERLKSRTAPAMP